LRVLKDGSIGRQYKLKNDKLEVGRLPVDVQFPEDERCAVHARFSVEKDSYSLKTSVCQQRGHRSHRNVHDARW